MFSIHIKPCEHLYLDTEYKTQLQSRLAIENTMEVKGHFPEHRQ